MRIFTYCLAVVAAIMCFQVISADDRPVAPKDGNIGTRSEAFEFVDVHDSTDNDMSVHTESSAMARIARMGVPLVIAEQDGEYVWRDQSSRNSVRVVNIGTDQLTSLRRFLNPSETPSDLSPGFTLQTAVELDTDTGTYELSRVELGLFGERFWLVHEQRGAEDEFDMIGIQIKTEW